MGDKERFDPILLGLAQQHTGGIEDILDTFFGFLYRKTDFFAGSTDGAAEGMVVKAARRFQEKADVTKGEREAKEKKKKEEKEKKKKENEERERKKLEEQPKIVEITEEEEAAIKKEEEEKKEEAKPAATPAAAGDGDGDDDDGEEKETGTAPNVGNGGDGPNYTWAQTLQELDVKIQAGRQIKGRDVDVRITATRLLVKIKGSEECLVDGELCQRVKEEDSFWTIEDGRVITINLQKVNQMEWWKNVIKGHDEINLQKVKPEDSKLDDLDGETRQTVEKMMHDQRQKAQGLPTSEEASKRKMLEKFMKEHPEMDFSQAKFS